MRSIIVEIVSCVIGIDTDFKFPIMPEVQVEMNKTFLSEINKTTIKKVAHVQSKEAITQLSIEQLFDENTNKTYEDKYFDNIQDALKWCNS